MDWFVSFLYEYPSYAIAISLFLNILIAVLGVVPSYFITAGNLLFFGLYPGLLLSFTGEAIGAIVAFVLYRKGFRNLVRDKLSAYPRASVLLDLDNKEAFWLILYLRLLPFVPSGVVTFSASAGKVTLSVFAIASSAGKVPAMVIEAFTVYQIIRISGAGKMLIGIFLILMALKIYQLIVKRHNKKDTGIS